MDMNVTLKRFSPTPSTEKTRNKERILLVDDDDSLRVCLRDYLELRGFSCVEAENGKEALQVMKTNRVDMIITDNQMPHMDGLSFIEHVNRNFSGDLLPIFLMTAELSHPVRLRAFKSGVNRVFEKPFDFQELSHAVEWVAKFDLPQAIEAKLSSLG